MRHPSPRASTGLRPEALPRVGPPPHGRAAPLEPGAPPCPCTTPGAWPPASPPRPPAPSRSPPWARHRPPPPGRPPPRSPPRARQRGLRRRWQRGAVYANDFVELVNPGSTAVDLSGWKVWYASAAGTSWAGTPLSGSIAPGATYLVQEAAGTNTALPALPTPDAVGTLGLSGTSGKIALTNTATAPPATGASTAANVVDFVGYGTADEALGTATPTLGNATSAARTDSPTVVDTRDNGADFTVGAPSPRAPTRRGPAAAAPPFPPRPTAPPARRPSRTSRAPASCRRCRATVDQGRGHRHRSASELEPGFWIQQAHPDPARTPRIRRRVRLHLARRTVAVGDDVLVSGKVSDFYPLSSGETVANTSSLSGTEIAADDVTTRSQGNALPASLAAHPDHGARHRTPPPTASGNIEAITTVDPSRSAQEFWEALEGMLVQVNDARVVGPASRVRRGVRDHEADQQATPRGGTVHRAVTTRTPSGRLLITPDRGTAPAANVGDVLRRHRGPGRLVDVRWLRHRRDHVGARQDNHLHRQRRDRPAADQLAVATYNVENLAPGDPQAKYDAARAGVVTNLAVTRHRHASRRSRTTAEPPTTARSPPTRRSTKLTAAITAAGGPTTLRPRSTRSTTRTAASPAATSASCSSTTPAGRVRRRRRRRAPSTTAVTVATGADGTPSCRSTPDGSTRPTRPGPPAASRSPASSSFSGKKVDRRRQPPRLQGRRPEHRRSLPAAGRAPRRSSAPSRRPCSTLRQPGRWPSTRARTSCSPATSTTTSSPGRSRP